MSLELNHQKIKTHKDRKKICLGYENKPIKDNHRGIAHNFQLQV